MSGRQKEWILEVRVAGLMCFIFRNEMRRGVLEMERVSFTVNERRKWSVMFIGCKFKRGDTRAAD